MPKRVQLRRTRGWRKPEGVIVVSRPSRWGNPFRPGTPHPEDGHPMDLSETIAFYRSWLTAATGPTGASMVDEARAELAGHDLACWCPLGQPCHAEVLLEVANRPVP
jgi:hypothetical protein